MTISSFAVVSIKGEEAPDFVQRIFCNDIALLSNGNAQFSGLCNAQGRLVCNGFFLSNGDEFLFLLHPDVAEKCVTRLQMYVLRSAVNISLEPRFQGIILERQVPDREAIVQGTFSATANPIQLAVCEAGWVAPGAKALPRTLIAGGIGIIGIESSEKYVPQLLNMDLLEGVSFKKGCYPGQEVVTRMQFLGRAKQRLFPCSVADTTAQAGTQIVARDGASFKAVGEVIAVDSELEETRMLAVIRLNNLANPALFLDSPEGAPVSIEEPPYKIDRTLEDSE